MVPNARSSEDLDITHIFDQKQAEDSRILWIIVVSSTGGAVLVD